MENKLQTYEPGNINMKPDVLKQIKELEIKRKDMEKQLLEERQKNNDLLNAAKSSNQSKNTKMRGIGEMQKR